MIISPQGFKSAYHHRTFMGLYVCHWISLVVVKDTSRSSTLMGQGPGRGRSWVDGQGPCPGCQQPLRSTEDATDLEWNDFYIHLWKVIYGGPTMCLTFFLFVWIYSMVNIKHFVWSMFVTQSAFWWTAWTHHDKLIFGKDVLCRADVMIYLSVLSAWPFTPEALTCLAQRYEKLIWNSGNMGIVSLLVWVGDVLRATSFPVFFFVVVISM